MRGMCQSLPLTESAKGQGGNCLARDEHGHQRSRTTHCLAVLVSKAQQYPNRQLYVLRHEEAWCQ